MMTQASNQTWAQGHALTFGSWDVDVGERGPRSKGGVAKMARRLRVGLECEGGGGDVESTGFCRPLNWAPEIQPAEKREAGLHWSI